MKAPAAVAAATIALLSCSPHGADEGRKTAENRLRTKGVRIARQPPTAKDVIDAVIASGDVPLSVSDTCRNVGTETSDATIGDYLAGFLAEMSSPDKKNWIETKIEPGKSTAGEPGSICTLTLRHEDGDDRWGWGVRFFVRSSDGALFQNSFTCVGAG